MRQMCRTALHVFLRQVRSPHINRGCRAEGYNNVVYIFPWKRTRIRPLVRLFSSAHSVDEPTDPAKV